MKLMTRGVYALANDTKVVFLRPIVLSTEHKLTFSGGSFLESIHHPIVVSSMCIFIYSKIGQNKLSPAFKFNRVRRKVELSIQTAGPLARNFIRKLHLRLCVKAVFGFVEYHENAAVCLGYKELQNEILIMMQN